MTGKRKALKVFRVQNDLTQAEMAERIGCGRSNYAQIELGNKNGSQAFWKKLQTAFDVADEAMWELMK